MIYRLFIVFALIAFTAAGLPSKAEGVKFTPAALEAAQKSGMPVLVHITAPWCPVCRAQKPIVNELTSNGKFKDFVVLDIDFDSQQDAVRAMSATAQSTLIVFKGASEAGRSAGDADAASIEALLAKAL